MATTVTGSATTWDEVEEKDRGEFPVLPAGVYEDCYLADYTKRQVKQGENKGKDYYSPEFIVSTDDGEFHVWGYWDTRKAKGFMKKDLAVLGVSLSGLDIDDVEGLEERLDSAKGQSCRLRLKVSQYESEDDDGNKILKDKNEIKAILPA